MALPESAGVLDPRDVLQEPKRSEVLGMADEAPASLEPGVRPCHLISKSNEIVLATRMLRASMAVLLPEHKALRDSRGKVIRGGIFLC